MKICRCPREISKIDQRRSARIAGVKEKITQEGITTTETIEEPIFTVTPNLPTKKVKIGSSEDDSDLSKKSDFEQTNEDAEFAR